jgi:hypothetical protein
MPQSRPARRSRTIAESSTTINCMTQLSENSGCVGALLACGRAANIGRERADD